MPAAAAVRPVRLQLQRHHAGVAGRGTVGSGAQPCCGVWESPAGQGLKLHDTWAKAARGGQGTHIRPCPLPWLSPSQNVVGVPEELTFEVSSWGIIRVISTVPSAFHGTPHRPTPGFILSSQGPKYYPEANDPLIHTSSTDHSPKLHTPASTCWPMSPPTPALSSRRSPALPPGPSPDDSSSRLQASSGPIPTHQDCLSALPFTEVQNPTPRTRHYLLPLSPWHPRCACPQPEVPCGTQCKLRAP